MSSPRKAEPKLVTTAHDGVAAEGANLIGVIIWGDPRFRSPFASGRPRMRESVLVHADRVAFVARDMCKLAGIPQPGDLEWARKAKELLLRAHEFVGDATSDAATCSHIHKCDVATGETLLEEIEELLPETKE